MSSSVLSQDWEHAPSMTLSMAPFFKYFYFSNKTVSPLRAGDFPSTMTTLQSYMLEWCSLSKWREELRSIHRDRGVGGILVLGVTFVIEHHHRLSEPVPWKIVGELRPDPRYPGSQGSPYSATFPGYISKKGLKTVSLEKLLKSRIRRDSACPCITVSRMLIDTCLLFKNC